MRSVRAKINPYANLQLRRQLYYECRAMAEFALAKGKLVPAAAIRIIEEFEREIAVYDTLDMMESEEAAGDTAPFRESACRGIEEMVKVHQTLVKIIEPATPKTILLLDMEEEVPGFWRFLGPVPLVRHMMLVAMLCLLSFIYLISDGQLSPEAAANPLNSIGSLFFMVTAAGMGASFVALYSANAFITEGTFDPAYYSSYWIRFLLGVMSGLVLSIIIAPDTLAEDNLLAPGVARPLLAILGGFSSDLVYTLLARFVETLQSLVQGSTKALVKAHQEEARSKQDTHIARNRMKLAADILRLQREMGSDANPREVYNKLNGLLQDLIPETDDAPLQLPDAARREDEYTRDTQQAQG